MESYARYLQPIEIIDFFLNQPGGRTTNHDLIKHFRPFLIEENFGKDNHAFLKKITAQLVTVKKIKGNKYLELKQEFKNGSLDAREILRLLEQFEQAPRSRTPIYDPLNQNVEDYFVTSKKEATAPSSEDPGLYENIEVKQPEVPPVEEDQIYENVQVKPPLEPEPEPEVEERLPPLPPKRSSLHKTKKKPNLSPIKEDVTVGPEHEEEANETEDDVFEEDDNKMNTLKRSRVSVKDLSTTFDKMAAEKELEQKIKEKEIQELHLRANKANRGK